MAEKNDYMQILNRARRKRNKTPWILYATIGLIAVVLIVWTIIGFGGRKQETIGEGVTSVATPEESIGETIPEATLSQEEQAKKEEENAKQEVIDSYSNLGLAQVSGYLNIRETSGSNGKIIGKLQGDSACEIISTEGEWHQITSGGISGYIYGQYVLTGEEAKAAAKLLVKKFAMVNTEKLNIRSEASIDPNNVLGQALKQERYAVEEELEGWVKIGEGFLSTDYVTVQYGLNEARKLDLKAMALNQYDNPIISKVDGYLNIRKEPKEDGISNIIGKFPSRAAGEVLETIDGWYKIKSGSITGYVKADSKYVAVGQEAKDLALEAATLMAIVNTDKLNVRSEPTTDSSVWTQISKEERYPVAEQLDGWVQIELDTGDGEATDKAFIATRDGNVEVRYSLTEAIKFAPVEEKVNKELSLRSKVVNYGLTFVGGRYVWGGTNPNTGADCSGFVQYVLRNTAGVRIPRTSREQAKAGRSINSSTMRPGDLVFYTDKRGVVNHVSMYIGNGQVVHAASKKSGIKISTWNYRTPKYIRNVID